MCGSKTIAIFVSYFWVWILFDFFYDSIFVFPSMLLCDSFISFFCSILFFVSPLQKLISSFFWHFIFVLWGSGLLLSPLRSRISIGKARPEDSSWVSWSSCVSCSCGSSSRDEFFDMYIKCCWSIYYISCGSCYTTVYIDGIISCEICKFSWIEIDFVYSDASFASQWEVIYNCIDHFHPAMLDEVYIARIYSWARSERASMAHKTCHFLIDGIL